MACGLHHRQRNAPCRPGGRRLGAGLLLQLLTLPAYAAQQESSQDKGVVRVAIPASHISEQEGTDSGYTNYTMGYLHEIAQYTGWTYEVVKVPGTYEDGLRQALEMLQNGQVDFVAPVAWLQGVGGGISFSRSSYMTARVVLQVPNACYDGLKATDELRVALMEKNAMQDTADTFFTQHQVDAQYVWCQNVGEQIQAVLAGEADVMLNSALEYIPNMSVVAEFGAEALYFAARDEALLRELDNTLTHINQANPMFSRDLYERYFMGYSYELTLEEMRFIQQSEPYAVAVLDGNAPYQYFDSETGTYRGIGVDLLRDISEKTGLQFEFVAAETWDTALQWIAEGKVQMIAGMPYDYAFAADRDLTITSGYASSPYVLLAKRSFQGPSKGQKLAQVNPNTYTDGQYIGDVVFYDNMSACVEAVQRGQADYTYVDLYTARYYTRYSTMQMVEQSYSPRVTCFGLAKPTPHELISILNKSIHQLSAQKLQSITTQNVNQARGLTPLDVIIANPVESTLTIGIISIVVAVLLVYLLWRREKVHRTMRRKAMEDGLTHLYHAAACRKLVTHGLKQLGKDQMAAFLIMGMDNFKQINDSYGHQMGDQVLLQFSNLLRFVFGEDNIVARIGGDEFVVYLSSIEKPEDVGAICERLQRELHGVRRRTHPSPSASAP